MTRETAAINADAKPERRRRAARISLKARTGTSSCSPQTTYAPC